METKPIHEILIDCIRGINSGNMRFADEPLNMIIAVVEIPEEHKKIITAIDEELKRPRDLAREMMLGAARRTILQRKAEVEARKAEQANQVTDAEKIAALADLLRQVVAKSVAPNLTGHDAQIAGELINNFNGAVSDMETCKTKQNLKFALQLARDLVR